MILLDIPEGFQLHPHVLIPLGYRLWKTLTPLGLVEGLIRGPHVVHIWSPLGFNEVVLGRMLRAKQILQRLLPWFLLHTSTSLLLMVGNSCGLLICVVTTILWHHSRLHKLRLGVWGRIVLMLLIRVLMLVVLMLRSHVLNCFNLWLLTRWVRRLRNMLSLLLYYILVISLIFVFVLWLHRLIHVALPNLLIPAALLIDVCILLILCLLWGDRPGSHGWLWHLFPFNIEYLLCCCDPVRWLEGVLALKPFEGAAQLSSIYRWVISAAGPLMTQLAAFDTLDWRFSIFLLSCSCRDRLREEVVWTFCVNNQLLVLRGDLAHTDKTWRLRRIGDLLIYLCIWFEMVRGKLLMLL